MLRNKSYYRIVYFSSFLYLLKIISQLKHTKLDVSFIKNYPIAFLLTNVACRNAA